MRRFVLAVAFAASLAARASGITCSPTTFIQGFSVPVGGSPQRVAIGLMNADAFPDLVVTRDLDVVVLPGLGDGSFGPPIVTSVNAYAFGVAVADLDGDTKLDLVIGSYGEILVLLGHGDGTFDAPVAYFLIGGPIVSIVTGTFDANASIDVAVVGYTGSLSVLLGQGNGTFGTASEYAVSGATALTTGDFGGDGKLDLATANGEAGTIALLTGIGDGTFSVPVYFVAGQQLWGITSADFDDDGHLDVATSGSGAVSVLLGNGNGTFQAALLYLSAQPAGQIAAADFNLDGSIDLTVASQGYSLTGTSVLLGHGDGSFADPAEYLSGEGAQGLAVADLDGDGLPDLATGDSENNAVSLLFDQADGALFAAPLTFFPAGPSSPSFAQADFNGDGRLDLVWPTGPAILALGSVHGRFLAGEPLPPPPSNQSLSGVSAGEYTGDGKPDVVAADYSNMWLYPGLGDGTFAPAEPVFSAFYPIANPASADFNGDGKLDIAIAPGCCGGNPMVVLLGNGDGTFQPPVTTDLMLSLRLLLAADVTGDGIPDLVADTGFQAVLLPGNGDGTFGTALELSPTLNSAFAASGDFNGDGHPDLLLSGYGTSVRLLLGNGDGTFQAPILIGFAASTAALGAGDFDGDGTLDFVVYAGSAFFLRGLGNGHFESPVPYDVLGQPSFLAVGDFDGNGALDVVSAANSLTTLVNSRLGATVASISTIVESPAVFEALAAGSGPVTYQWRKGGVPLSDGGTISGVTTATLTIDPVAFTDAGLYDVVVTDSCGTTNSNSATLTIEFDDVPTSSPFHHDIITIATAGITGGCGIGTSYCPTASVSRAEMAVLLLKSLYGADHVPPPPPVVPIFPDVPADAFAAAWIDELAGLQITAGCGDGSGNYCPDAPVTRGQMAVFLLKTLLGFDHVPPPATGIFADVPADYFSIDWIEDLYNRNITAGCNFGPLRYCPDDAVPREQMATFLVRTFSIGP